MYLEAPDYILKTMQTPDRAPRWIFPSTTKAAIHELFARATLPADMEQQLLDSATPDENGAIVLHPKSEDIEGLKPEARQLIYSELAKSPLNEFHRDPLIITGSLDEWLRDSRLRRELQDDIRRLAYQSGHTTVFSDIRLLVTHAKSTEEERQICRAITRTRTLMGQLRITPSSNAKQLIEYWTGGHSASDVMPMLEAATDRTGGMTIDVSHFLPPFARRRLYTFPAPDLLVRGRLPDCHWTSLNFFNAVTQDYYLDMRLAASRLMENYTVVDSPYHFGDMLCLLNPDGQAIHSCIYIADDVVFTKNGENGVRPWILMPLQEVRDYYSRDSSVLKGFRRKVPGPI